MSAVSERCPTCGQATRVIVDAEGTSCYSNEAEAETASLYQQLAGAVEALRLIAEHARLDHAERGIAEAERYAVIANDALARFGGQ